MRQLFYLSLFLFFITSECLSQNNKFYFSPLVGFRIVDDKSTVPGVSRVRKTKIFPISVIGVEIGLQNRRLSLSLQRDIQILLFAFNSIDTVPSLPSPIFESKITDHAIFYYKLKKKISIGIGHYWVLHESIADYFGFGTSSRYKGVEFLIAMQHSKVSFELRRQLPYAPLFDPLGRSLTSVAIAYKIGKKDEHTLEASSTEKIKLAILTGSRFFHPEGVETIEGENLNKVVLSPLIGLEIYGPKQDVSLYAEKDLWLGINSGSFTRNFKGLISNTAIGLRYHHELRNERHLRYGLGATWIDDFQIRRDNRYTKSTNDLRYDEFGIGANASYEIFRRWDIEVRHVFTMFEDKTPLNLRRFSLGLIHRFDKIGN